MSEPYVPTTEEFRAAWMVAGPPSQTVVRAWQFERGMDAHDREVKAEAWDEAIDFMSRHYEDFLPLGWSRHADGANPYRIESQETP